MVPIGEYCGNDRTDLTDYDDFIDEVLSVTLEELNIPDPEDRESRTPQLNRDEESNRLRISYSIGPSEYEYHLGKGNGRFEPSPEQRNNLALRIAELRERYGIEMNRLEIVEWRNSVFELIREEDLEPEISNDSFKEEELQSLELFKSRLYVNSPELVPQFTDLIPGCEIIVVDGSDAPVSLELDSDVDVDRDIKEQLADSLKKRLISKMNSNKDFEYSTVWVRSGKPDIYAYNGNDDILEF